MDQKQIQEKVDDILSKPLFKFHTFNKDTMTIVENGEATPATAYYERREKLDIMNALFEEEIEYKFEEEHNQIVIKSK